MNAIRIEGRVGRDPELRYVSDGRAWCKFSVADSYTPRGKDGSWDNDRTETVWWDINLNGDDAERAAETLRKGSKVIVEGRVALRKYTAADGRTGTAMEVKFAKVTPADKPVEDLSDLPF